MGDNFKTKLIIALVILCVLFFVGMIGSCSNASRLKVLRDKEMGTRLDLEEGISKEKQSYEKKISALKQESEKEKASHEVTKKILAEQEVANSELKEKLSKEIELREAPKAGTKESQANSAKTNIKQ